MLRAAVAVATLVNAARAQVVINEVLADPDADPMEEWAELYNAGADAVDIGGWSLTDNNGYGSSGSITLDAGAAIAAGEYLVVVMRASDGLLNNGGDDVQLHDASGVPVDEISWTSSHGDLSLARLVRTHHRTSCHLPCAVCPVVCLPNAGCRDVAHSRMAAAGQAAGARRRGERPTASHRPRPPAASPPRLPQPGLRETWRAAPPRPTRRCGWAAGISKTLATRRPAGRR